jgi:hypothetical protein
VSLNLRAHIPSHFETPILGLTKSWPRFCFAGDILISEDWNAIHQMTLSDSVPAKDSQKLNQAGAAKGVLGSSRKYCYVGVRCKSCLQEGRTSWLLLKYLGLNGNTPYSLVLPPVPRMARFHMHCETCDVDDSYTPNEAQLVSLEQSPPPDFVNQY